MLKPIPARRWDIPLIEHPGDRPDTEPLGTPLINLLNHRCCFRIDHKTTLVFGVLAIAVWGIITDIIAILTLGLQRCTRFHGDILCIIVVYNIFDGDRQFVPGVDVVGIVVVID